MYRKGYVHLILPTPGDPLSNWAISACGECWMEFRSTNRTKERAKITCEKCQAEVDTGGTDVEIFRRVLARKLKENDEYWAKQKRARERERQKITEETP